MTCLVHPDTQVRLPPEYMVLCGSYPESGTTGLLRVSCNPSHHGVVIAGLIANAQVKTACLGCVVRLFDAVESNEEADTIRRSLVTVTDDGNTRPTSMLSAFVAFLAQTTPMPVSYPPLTRFFFFLCGFLSTVLYYCGVVARIQLYVGWYPASHEIHSRCVGVEFTSWKTFPISAGRGRCRSRFVIP